MPTPSTTNPYSVAPGPHPPNRYALWGSVSSNQIYGPWDFGGFRYVAGEDADPSGHPIKTGVWKTSDDATFTLLDGSGSQTINASSPVVTAFKRTGQNVLDITYIDPVTGNLSTVAFDMNTDTYGAANNSGPLALSTVIMNVSLSSGSQVVFFNTVITGTKYLKFVIFSSGVWGSPVTIDSTVTGETLITSFGVTNNDRIYVLYFVGPDELKFTTVVSGALGSIVDLGIESFYQWHGAGVYDSMADKIYFPILDLTSFFSSSAFNLYTIDSASTGGFSSTIEAVGGNPSDPDASSWKYPSAFIYNSQLCLAYLDFTHLEKMFVFYRPLSGGSWSSATLLWDFSVQPPLPDGFVDLNAGLSILQIGGGKFGALIDVFESICGNLYYLTGTFGAAPPPPPPGGGGHQICTTGGGSIPNSLQIVRTYRFENEPLPADQVFFCPWSDMGYPFEKTARNLRLDIDTGNVACSVIAQTDANTVQTFTVTSNSNERIRILPFTPNLTGRLWRLSLTPGVGGKCQLFSAGIDFVAEPGAVDFVDTYEQDLGYPGWKFVKQCWLTYQSFQAITITFLVENRMPFYSVTLPAHANRDVERFYLPAINLGVLNKSRKYSVQITSTGTFRLYANSAFEWFGIGTDQRGTYSLAALTPEMQQSVAQPLIGNWPKPVATSPSDSAHPG